MSTPVEFTHLNKYMHLLRSTFPGMTDFLPSERRESFGGEQEKVLSLHFSQANWKWQLDNISKKWCSFLCDFIYILASEQLVVFVDSIISVKWSTTNVSMKFIVWLIQCGEIELWLEVPFWLFFPHIVIYLAFCYAKIIRRLSWKSYDLLVIIDLVTV